MVKKIIALLLVAHRTVQVLGAKGLPEPFHHCSLSGPPLLGSPAGRRQEGAPASEGTLEMRSINNCNENLREPSQRCQAALAVSSLCGEGSLKM